MLFWCCFGFLLNRFMDFFADGEFFGGDETGWDENGMPEGGYPEGAEGHMEF